MSRSSESIGTKSTRRDIIAVAIFLAIVLLVWVGLTAIPSADISCAPKSDGAAVFDLRSSDFSNTIHVINNRDDWDSWPERLYTPQDFENGIVGQPRTLTNDDYGHYQFFTHRVTLLLVPGTTYGISSLISTPYSMRLFVGGEQAVLVGVPGATRAETIPRTHSFVHYFVPQDERVDIIIQTSNFVHQFGGEPQVMYIGSMQNIERLRFSGTLVIFLVSGSLLTSALYHLALFLMSRKRKAELIFSACCFLGFMMAIEPIPLFFPEYNWSVMFRVEYLVFYGTFGMTGYLFAVLMPHYAPKRIMRIYYSICGVLMLTAIFLDTTVFTGFINFFYPIGVSMILFGVARLGIALKHGRVQDFLAFIGLLVIMIFTANDVLYHARIPFLIDMRHFLPSLGIYFTAPIGIVFFVFCYALLLALKYADTEREAMETKAREEAIAAENAALENLSRVKTGFLQDIKHEVRNPLHVISLGVDYVNEYFTPKGDADEARKVLATMQNEAMRLGRMVEGMVELATMEGSKTSREKIDLAEIIMSCADTYRLKLDNNRNTLRVKTAENLPFIYAESEQLTRVIINILSNANDSVTDGEISIEALADNVYIIVHIRDNGSGIDPQLLPRVFERGVSGKGREGYGLSMCKTIVEAHGGELRIESGELGIGTVVTFTIPVYGGQGN